MSEDDLMDEIDLFVEIDGLRAELAAVRAEVGRLATALAKCEEAKEDYRDAMVVFDCDAREARAEIERPKAVPPRTRPDLADLAERLRDKAKMIDKFSWDHVTRDLLNEAADAVAAALDGTSPRPRSSRPELVGAILLAVSPYVKPGASPEVLGEAIAAALEEADRNAEACLRAQEEARRENDRLRDQIARLNALRGRRAPRVVEGIAVDVRGTTHAFGSADDFRTFVADHGNWVRAQWSDLVVWHPAGDDDTPLATGTGRPAVAVITRGRKAHLFESGEDARNYLVEAGDDWGTAAWIEGIEWHPAGPPPAAPREGKLCED